MACVKQFLKKGDGRLEKLFVENTRVKLPSNVRTTFKIQILYIINCAFENKKSLVEVIKICLPLKILHFIRNTR